MVTAAVARRARRADERGDAGRAGRHLRAALRPVRLHAVRRELVDEGFTAPRHGYAGADDFYEANSSQHFLGGIRAPTLLIHAQDDPFVPAAPYLKRKWSGEPHLTPMLPKSGGHLGFHDPLGLWHLRQIHAFFEEA